MDTGSMASLSSADTSTSSMNNTSNTTQKNNKRQRQEADDTTTTTTTKPTKLAKLDYCIGRNFIDAVDKLMKCKQMTVVGIILGYDFPLPNIQYNQIMFHPYYAGDWTGAPNSEHAQYINISPDAPTPIKVWQSQCDGLSVTAHAQTVWHNFTKIAKKKLCVTYPTDYSKILGGMYKFLHNTSSTYKDLEFTMWYHKPHTKMSSCKEVKGHYHLIIMGPEDKMNRFDGKQMMVDTRSSHIKPLYRKSRKLDSLGTMMLYLVHNQGNKQLLGYRGDNMEKMHKALLATMNGANPTELILADEKYEDYCNKIQDKVEGAEFGFDQLDEEVEVHEQVDASTLEMVNDEKFDDIASDSGIGSSHS